MTISPRQISAGAASGPIDQLPGAAAISLRDAAVRLAGRVIWSDVSLEVPGGEFVAVLGPNGAGKSTLVKVLLGLQPLAAGSAEVLGRPPGEANARIGYLPQRRSFPPGLRVRGIDVVRLGLDGNRWGVPLPGAAKWNHRQAAAAARIREVLAMVDATHYADRPIGEVSGGEQQRLLIAQALARDPALLFMDEPLDSLDLPNQRSTAALIQRICRQQAVTVLIVVHDINPILHYLDRVIYLASGRAVSGSPAEVITSECLSQLYSWPIEVLRTSDDRLVVVGEPEAAAIHADRHAG